MAVSSRGLAVLGMLVAGAASFRRIPHPDRDSAPATKFIAGVPVHNYAVVRAASDMSSKGDGADIRDIPTDTAEHDWVVMLKHGASATLMKDMCKLGKHDCEIVGHAEGVPFLKFRGTGKVLETVLESGKDWAEFAEPDMQISKIPEITEEGSESLVEAKAATWGLTKIGADSRGTMGNGVTVFVLDTGVRVSHQEFGFRAASFLDMSSGSANYCSGSLSCAQDRDGHGTHCAGSAVGQNVGVAPGAQVRSIKVLSDQGTGQMSWSYSGLDAIASSGIRPAVASMSLGGKGRSYGMQSAVNSAVSAGVVVVVAAGNENDDACGYSPAFIASAITVGSITSTDTRSGFSNYGSCTNIWAPGSSINSAGHTSDSGRTVLSGTSMACPHVSGAAALLLETDGTMSGSRVQQALLANAWRNGITGLSSQDTNALIHVGSGGPPPSPAAPPAPVPGGCPMHFSTGPDSDGDCMCHGGLYCYYGWTFGCPFSYTAQTGQYHAKYFLPSCTDCQCSSSMRGAQVAWLLGVALVLLQGIVS